MGEALLWGYIGLFYLYRKASTANQTVRQRFELAGSFGRLKPPLQNKLSRLVGKHDRRRI